MSLRRDPTTTARKTHHRPTTHRPSWLTELLCLLDAELTEAGVIPTEVVLLVAFRS